MFDDSGQILTMKMSEMREMIFDLHKENERLTLENNDLREQITILKKDIQRREEELDYYLQQEMNTDA